MDLHAEICLTDLGPTADGHDAEKDINAVLGDRRVPDVSGLAETDQRGGKAKIPAEMYLGSSGMKAQMKYADRRNAPCVIIQGEDELVDRI